MRRGFGSRHTRLELIVLALALSGVGLAQAKKKKPRRPPNHHFIEDEFGFHGGMSTLPDFQVQGPGLQDELAPDERATRSHAGSTLIAIEGAYLVLDRDAGALIVSDRHGDALTSLEVGEDPTQMVWDAKRRRVWVADHRGDRIVAVEVGDAAADFALREEKSLTVFSPWGLALHPDGRRLFVTSSVQGTVRQIDTQVMKKSWERKLGPEPRPVAVSPDGQRLMVGFLSLGATAELSLGAEVEATPREVIYHSIDPGVSTGHAFNLGLQQHLVMPQQAQVVGQGTSSPNAGKSFARNTFALAYLGPQLAVVPHQLSTPVAENVNQRQDFGGYGGGGDFTFPISHRLTFLQGEGESTQGVHVGVGVHQPRALAYDAARDRLYVVGYGDDSLVAIDEATSPNMHLAYKVRLHGDASAPTPDQACGADGIALSGATVAVHCGLERSVRVLSADDGSTVHGGSALVASHMSPAAQRGAEVFRRGGDARISTRGAMACASCHPEGLTDGLSWRIEGRELQTPLITGRLVGTHPFKWDGQDKDLPSSLRNTVGRLGGSGLSEAEANDLQAYLEGLAAPRAPLALHAAAIERGRELFESEQLACDACHSGKTLADGQMHSFSSDLPEVDTPSLVGLARSAPYYHDGSAPTLRSLLLDNGRVHGMVATAELPSSQVDDLIAYLETL